MKVLPFTLALIALCVAVSGQSPSAGLKNVYIGQDGLAHVVDETGKDIAVPRESYQVDVTSPQLAPNHRTAGWIIEQDNCCTSYPIAIGVALYQNGKKRVLGDGLMVYDWCFVAEGAQVALSTGTVHGMTSRHLLLYDTGSGRQLHEWNGDPDAKPPAWGGCLKE
ncbi:MAG: hypothetical protein JO300_12685 [Silvibacterium sp.]|nr:hypothetical protein [Silvibacterium sp.]